MHIKVLAQIDHFKVDQEDIPFRWMWFSKEKRFIRDNFENDTHFMSNVGSLSIDSVLSNPSFLYGNCDYILDGVNYEVKALRILDNLVHVLTDFMGKLWFIKDCCCNIDNIMLKLISPEYCASATVPVKNHPVNGEYESATFTLSDIKEVEMINAKWLSIATIIGEDEINDQVLLNASYIPSAINKTSYEKYTRIDRAMAFLDKARTAEFIPMKIGMYIPLLECLFSTSPAKVAHSVSLRSSSYLSISNSERKELYKTVKRAYRVRSHYLHGSKLDDDHKSINGQIKTCIEMDNIVRMVLKKVILNDSALFLSNNDILNKEFQNFKP